MTARSLEDRARDVELVADVIIETVRAALPSLVRKEVELQLRASPATDDEPSRPQRGTLPRPGKA